MRRRIAENIAVILLSIAVSYWILVMVSDAVE